MATFNLIDRQEESNLLLTERLIRDFLGEVFNFHQQTYDLADRERARQILTHGGPHYNTPGFHRHHANRAEAVQADATYDTITQGRQPPMIDEESFVHPHPHRHRSSYPDAPNIVRNTLIDRQLVELRQTRALLGLTTSELDEEITRRVLRDPRAWGWVGTEMAVRGWVDDMEVAQRSFRVEREEALPQYRWHNSRRGTTRGPRAGSRLQFIGF